MRAAEGPESVALSRDLREPARRSWWKGLGRTHQDAAGVSGSQRVLSRVSNMGKWARGEV